MTEGLPKDTKQPDDTTTTDVDAAGKTSDECLPGGEASARRENALVMTPWSGLAVAWLAGLVVWGTLETILPVFQLSEQLRELSGNAPAAEQQALREALKGNQDKNAILSVVLMAAALAMTLTAAELLFRGKALRAVWGGLLAGLVAGVVAIGAGVVAVSLHDALDLEGNRLGKTIVVQAALLGVMGLGIGLAIAIAMLRLRLLAMCLTGCLIGGLLAALIFPFVVGICLPNLNTEFLVPTPGIGRLLWVGLTTGLIGAAVAGLSKENNKRRVRSPSAEGDTPSSPGS